MMYRLPIAMSAVRLSILGVALLAAACSPDGGDPTVPPGSGGQSGATGGSPGSGGNPGSGGSSASGGTVGTGGHVGSGGTGGSGGATSSGGSPATGGTSAIGGTTGVGGTTVGSGGSTTGGTTVVGGRLGSGGTAGTTARGGATTATGGAGGTSTGTTPTGGSTGALDCSAAMPAMPTSGGTTHCGSYRTGKAGSLNWELWSNSYSSNACITYYSTTAFSAKWNNNGDFLARLGIEWGGKSIATLGTITAEFTFKKSGTAGGFSYIGVYGWATNPCVEYYIIDDSYGSMPFKPYNMTEKGSATIDGEVYKFYSGSFNGTGGSRCTTPFQQYWSVRQKGRQCGVMTITKHFEEWKKVGMSMDNILEAKILAEAGGGTGSVEFPVANVKASN